MPNGRRAHVPGGSFFFTVVTGRRARFLTEVPARPMLGSCRRLRVADKHSIQWDLGPVVDRADDEKAQTEKNAEKK